MCIYCVESSTLVKKFQLSYNRSLEGVVDELRSDLLVDGVNVDTIAGDSDDEFRLTSKLPGTIKGATDGSRITKPEIMTSCIRFSPSGREWAAATIHGLQVCGTLRCKFDVSIHSRCSVLMKFCYLHPRIWIYQSPLSELRNQFGKKRYWSAFEYHTLHEIIYSMDLRSIWPCI